MKKKILFGLLSITLTISLLVGCGSTTEDTSDTDSSADDTVDDEGASETYELTMAMTSTSMTFASDFADLVYEYTNGAVSITIVDSSSLGSASDCVNMVREGTLDIIMLPSAQSAGEFPVSDITQVPFLVPDGETGQDIMYALLEAGYLDEYYDNTVPLFFACTDSQMIGFKEDVVITSIEDFKGMKIRAVSGITTNFVEDILGGTVVTMDMNDVYLSLSTGVVDAAFSSPVQMVSYSFADVMGSMMNYSCYVGLLYCVVNEDLWESLPEEIQEQIYGAGEVKRDEIREYYEEKQQECINTLAEAGVNVYEPSDELITEIIEKSESLRDVFIEDLDDVGIDGAAVMEIAEEIISGNN